MGFTFRDDEERWFKVLMRWLGEEQEGTEHIRSLAFACDGPRASSVRATVSTLATIDFPNLEELNVRLPSRGDDPKSNQEPANPMMEGESIGSLVVSLVYSWYNTRYRDRLDQILTLAFLFLFLVVQL